MMALSDIKQQVGSSTYREIVEPDQLIQAFEHLLIRIAIEPIRRDLYITLSWQP